MKRFSLRRATAPVLSSLDAYARWAAQYPPHAHNAFMLAEEAAMLSLLPDLTHSTIVDLGGGTGRYAKIAQDRGASITISLDNSLPMLQNNPVRQRVAAPLDGIPLKDACADGIICGLAVGHVSELFPVFRESARVLKPNGWLLLSDFHPFAFLSGGRRTFTDSDGRTFAVAHHVHLYSDYVSAACKTGLSIEAAAEPYCADAPAVSRDTPAALVVLLRRKANTRS